MLTDADLVQGSLHLILGPMFAGKTTRLLQAVREYRELGKSVLLVKSRKDTRYSADSVCTHDAEAVGAVPVARLGECVALAKQHDVIAIDEGQFFDDIDDVPRRLADEGHIVVIAGLSGTFKRQCFNGLIQLMAVADSVKLLHAKCKYCEKDAPFTLRIDRDKNAADVAVGGTDMYIPLCRSCYLSASKD